MEYFFQYALGVVATQVGYTGGSKETPTYKEVKTGTTGHAEAVEVIFDPALTTYEELTKLFLEIHDPTQLNKQGVDNGTQYRSAIFYMSEEQKRIAEDLIKVLKDKGLNVVTQVVPLITFWTAEDYHQRYLEKKEETPECHFYTQRFDKKPEVTGQ